MRVLAVLVCWKKRVLKVCCVSNVLKIAPQIKVICNKIPNANQTNNQEFLFIRVRKTLNRWRRWKPGKAAQDLRRPEKSSKPGNPETPETPIDPSGKADSNRSNRWIRKSYHFDYVSSDPTAWLQKFAKQDIDKGRSWPYPSSDWPKFLVWIRPNISGLIMYVLIPLNLCPI